MAHLKVSVQPESSDDELISRCRAGDGAAWELVLERYGSLVMAVARGCGLPDDLAADVSQSTFLAMLQQLDGLQKETTLGPWLATVARRKAWRTMHAPAGEPIDGAVLIATASDDFAPLERDVWLTTALLRLDIRCRDLLIALYLEQPPPTYQDIAERFDIAIGSVGPIRGRCLARMREILDP